MRVTWVTRSFLDYRIPVYEAMHRRLDGQFRIVYSADYVPQRCQQRLRAAIGDAAVGLQGEWRIGPNETAGFANKALRIVYQPGLMRAIGAGNPEVLIGDGFFQWSAFALAYRLIHPVKLVICYERTAHTERGAQALRTTYRRWTLRWVDAMSCNGALSRDYSTELGMPAGKITVGQMAADTHVLAARAAAVSAADRAAVRTSWGNPDLALVVVGRLNDRKGVDRLLEAWQFFTRDCTGTPRLVLVGDGPDRAMLEARVREAAMPGVIFMGHLDYDGIAPVYAAADALAVPTLEDNWSLVVPEAMACGLPVLCSVYNGCHPELVQPAGNGWLFDPLDLESTCEALRQCWSGRERLPAMGTRSREIVQAFTPEKAAEAIIEACQLAGGPVVGD
jgi:glycosyltransferase involved in cell wall biosynthesis